MYEGLAVSYARRLPSVALLRRVEGKAVRVSPQLSTFSFVSSKEKVRTLYFTILLQNSRKNYTSGRYTESTKFKGVKKKQ